MFKYLFQVNVLSWKYITNLIVVVVFTCLYKNEKCQNKLLLFFFWCLVLVDSSKYRVLNWFAIFILIGASLKWLQDLVMELTYQIILLPGLEIHLKKNWGWKYSYMRYLMHLLLLYSYFRRPYLHLDKYC